MTPLSELTAIIVKAVPEIGTLVCGKCAEAGKLHKARCLKPNWVLKVVRPITLEDVLRALDTVEWIFVSSVGKFWKYRNGKAYPLKQYWSLGKPLSSQSPETISFLLSLLRV